MNIDDLKMDISAFADDADDVVVDNSGKIIFVRNGVDVECRLLSGHGSAPDMIEMSDGGHLTYSKFLTHNLARLDALANKFVEMRPGVSFYVDGPGVLSRPAESTLEDSALKLLEMECKDTPAFASRVSFLTADAGHGKTALLRHYQHAIAQKFLKGEADFLFWHVDLQGRQLLRLSEALMGDLGELRHSGLWMPGVIRLMQKHKLILAVDGFDELSAEQGDADALGALTSLVEQLKGTGVIIAAARRTFFDAEDYSSKTRLLNRGLSSPCQFDQVSLMPWGAKEQREYVRRTKVEGRSFPDPSESYESILQALGSDPSHPMLARPFLLAQMTKALLTSSVTAADFVTTDHDPWSGVASVVRAFINREVTEKWIFPDTGEPYLTQTQHLELLAAVAEEMYRNQQDRLRLDVVETIAAILMDQWGTPPARQGQVMEMVQAHVLLVLPPDQQSSFRSFDHPEFRDFFVAQALKNHLEVAMASGDAAALARFLTYAPLSDSTARYVAAMVDRTSKNVDVAVSSLCILVKDEWRPTHLQTNAGTLVAALINGIAFAEVLTINAPLVISSLVFEGSSLKNVLFVGCNFVNLSLSGAEWNRVSFEDCEINELRIDRDSSSFADVVLTRTRVSSVIVSVNCEEEVREYAPRRIELLLSKIGISGAAEELPIGGTADEDSETLEAARKFISLFARSTTVTDHMVEAKFRRAPILSIITSSVIPLMLTHGLLEERAWRGAGSRKIWALSLSMDEVLTSAEQTDGAARAFWDEVAVL